MSKEHHAYAVRLPEGIRWCTFDSAREKRWLDRGEIVFTSKPFDSGTAAFNAVVALKKSTFSHMTKIGIYGESILPVLRASELAE